MVYYSIVDGAFSFDGHHLFENVSFSLSSHDRIVLYGSSGIGKSTLLSLVFGSRKWERGRHFATGSVHMQPQLDLLLPWKTVTENLHFTLARNSHKDGRKGVRDVALDFLKAASFSPKAILHKILMRRNLGNMKQSDCADFPRICEHCGLGSCCDVRSYLARCGLEDAAQKKPSALSQGMKQRVSFLRTLLSGRNVLLFDEPFANLDDALTLELITLLDEEQKKRGFAAVIVTHSEKNRRMLSGRTWKIEGARLIC